MGNEVANPFGGSVAMVDREEMAKRAAASAQSGARGGAPDSSEYLNFSGKRGVYQLGQDKAQVQNDELWLLNIASFEDGYVCWKGGKPAAQRMANIFGAGYPVAVPSDDEGGPFDKGRGEGWSFAKGWVSKSLDTDRQAYFRVNSVSGVSEMADLIEEVAQRMAGGEPCWPVFSYDNEEFEAQGYKNFKPKFPVSGWLTDEQVTAYAKGDLDLDDVLGGEEKPAVTKAPDPAEQQTTGRRRRRSA